MSLYIAHRQQKEREGIFATDTKQNMFPEGVFLFLRSLPYIVTEARLKINLQAAGNKY